MSTQANRIRASVLIALALPSAVWAQAAEPADSVYLNATVVTMAREGDVAEAVAVRGGKIAAVGSSREIRGQIGPKTKIVDLAGKTLLPGFYAAHDHFPSLGRVALYDVDLNSPPIGTIRTMDQLVAALREKAARTPAGQWVVGRGYDDTLLAEQRHPTRQDLDRASAEHPIWIIHTSGHLGVANSRALTLAKIDKNTPQPAGGAIRHDTAGEPTGVIEERTGLVNSLVPRLSQEQRLAAVKFCDGQYLAKGVTTTVIAGGAANVIPDLLAADGRGWLHLRALAMLSPPNGEPPTLAELAGRSPIPERVRYSGVKILQDGSLQGYTGYLTAPYFTQPEGRERWTGYALRPREQLVELV